jgi:hypothetical protein
MIDKSWPSNWNGRVLDKNKKNPVLGWFCSGGFGYGDLSGFSKFGDQGVVFWPSDFERNTTNP